MNELFDDEQRKSLTLSKDSNILAVGIGGAGVSVIDSINRNEGINWLSTAAIDTDCSLLEAAKADYKIDASSDWSVHSGMGCGGNLLAGGRAIDNVEGEISKLFDDAKLLFIIAGLGGGTGTGGILSVASLVKSRKIPAVFIVTTPFKVESYGSKKNAEQCLLQLRKDCEVLFVLPNDILFSQFDNLSLQAAYQDSSDEIAHLICGLSGGLQGHSMFGADYASFVNIVNPNQNICSIGIGIAERDECLDYCSLSVQRAIESPFLGGNDSIKKTDAVMQIISGGNDLTISEIKKTFEIINEQFPSGIEMIHGANISDNLTGKIQVSLVIVRCIDSKDEFQSQQDSIFSVYKSHKPQFSNEKLETCIPAESQNVENAGKILPSHISKRGIFDRVKPSIYKNEDLDVPVFLRRHIDIEQDY